MNTIVPLDRRSRAKIKWLGAVLAPVLAVQAIHLLGSRDPASASGSVTPSSPAGPVETGPAGAPRRTPSPEQLRALSWLAARAGDAPLRSPMDRPDAAPVPEPVPEPVQPAAAPAKERDPTDVLSLTGILGEEGRSLVSINMKVFRVGDDVLPGWRLIEIDPRLRAATIENRAGRRVVIRPLRRDR